MQSIQQIPPLCLALILADAIWMDPSTGKRTILGIFSSIVSPQFPAMQTLMAVHCALTDGYGKTSITIRLVDAEDEDEPLLEGTGDVEFEDPRAVVEMDFHFPGVTFPKPGEYRFQLFAGRELLMERRLVATPVVQGESNA